MIYRAYFSSPQIRDIQENTTVVDSSALGMLMLFREYVGRHSAKIILVHTSPQLKRLFEIARFHELFDIP